MLITVKSLMTLAHGDNKGALFQVQESPCAFE